MAAKDPAGHGRRDTRTPRERVAARLSGSLRPEDVEQLPRKWELLGDVLVLRLPDALRARGAAVAEAYAAELHARTVLEDVGGIAGELREPRMRHLWGDGTETTHVDNGLRYTFDAACIMFASGNNLERKRMGLETRPGERVVDLCAGIGYFTLPVARAGGVVTACELNPRAFAYLERNVRQNGVGDRVQCVLGDCREIAPKGAADRVIVGYLGGTARFLPAAMAALRPEGGRIHFHDAMPVEAVLTRPVEELARAAHGAGRELKGVEARVVKSYAPGIAHVVADARVS